MSVIGVSYEGPDGSFWSLEGENRHREIMLTGVSGLTATIERAISPRPSGVGVDINAHSYPAMQGALSFTVFGEDDPVRKGEIFRWFADSWKTRKPGKLTVVNSISGIYSISAYGERTMDVTEYSPQSHDQNYVDFSINVFSDDGVWKGRIRDWEGGNVHVPNRGDLPLYPVIVWSGAGKSVTLPSGVVVNLPTTPAGLDYYLSMDPSISFKVTDIYGEVVNAWADMRGFPVYGTIEPGESAVFSMSPGVVLQTQELIENPWR